MGLKMGSKRHVSRSSRRKVHNKKPDLVPDLLLIFFDIFDICWCSRVAWSCLHMLEVRHGQWHGQCLQCPWRCQCFPWQWERRARRGVKSREDFKYSMCFPRIAMWGFLFFLLHPAASSTSSAASSAASSSTSINNNTPSTQHHQYNIINTTSSTQHQHNTPSTQHHQHNTINTSPSTQHHQHNIINTTPSTQHQHNTPSTQHTMNTTPSTQHCSSTWSISASFCVAEAALGAPS